MRWPIVGHALLALLMLFGACGDPSQYEDPIDNQVAESTVEGMELAGLRAPRKADRCYEDRFRIEWAADAAEFARRCQVPPEKAYACFLWRLEVHPAMSLYSREYPSAYLRPGIEGDDVWRLGIHELLHGFSDCVLKRPQSDPYDYHHTDPRVWLGPGGVDSAEGQARLYFGMSDMTPVENCALEMMP
jgi:hypothetical protein